MKTYQIALDNIIKLRKKSGLTQQDMADAMETSRQRWNSVEKGVASLDAKELDFVASILGVSVVDLYNTNRNNEKFKQMYFYIINKAAKGSNNSLPKTKLAKLLYLADFSNFYDNLESMSGAQYIRREYGPVADIFFELTEDLFDKGKIDIRPYKDALMITSTSSDNSTSLLSNQEKAKIDQICALWKDKRTKEIVNFTHEQKPWRLCRDGEYIPYSLIIQEDSDHVYKPIAW